MPETSDTTRQVEESTSFVVSEADSGKRIDAVLAAQLDGVGRRLAGLLCQNGEVRLEGRRVKKSQLVKEGALVSVNLGSGGKAQPAPDLHLPVVLETAQLVIVDKAPGIPSAALVGKEHNTASGALLALYPEISAVGYGEREPGIVHRLDNYTSGLLLAARDQETFLRLREALSSGKIHKRYLAIVRTGILKDSGEIESVLTSDSCNAKKVMTSITSKGYFCRSEYSVRERHARFDLVEVRAHTAFRHQVRFHLASLGAPLIGDTLYGGEETLAPRHALHASYIEGEARGVPTFLAESSLPEDLRELLTRGD